MRINTILNRYIFLELIPPYLINLGFFTFIFLMAKILDITKMIVNYNVSIVSVLLIFIYSMPFFLIYVFPMATMMSILLTLLKLSNDNEIVAMKTCGMSLHSLLLPVLALCCFSALATAFMSIYALPWSRVAFGELKYNLASSHFEVVLKERTFNDSFNGIVIYVSKLDTQRKRIYDIFIEDQREPKTTSTIIAPEGRLYSDMEKMVHRFRLYNGSIIKVDLEQRASNRIHFETYDININLKETFAKQSQDEKDEEEMSLPELIQYLETADPEDDQYWIAKTELHRKFSVPIACFALGILAIPFGVQFKTAKRSFGLGLGLVFFMLYYMLLSAGWVLGEAGVYPPVIGMWLPNVLLGGLGIYFYTRAVRGLPLHVDVIFRLLESFQEFFLRKIIRKSDEKGD